ncbi:MAG: PRC-barrel domain-containing protein [Verrucomicrobiae bacterium]|nr:PRC-barrel domain-containing protein [Verrucomicrobiae bacterium]
MLQSIKKLYGQKLAALDGEIGQVKDVYFDDHSRAVRYVIADTGTWLTSRQVLLSPRALGDLRPDEKVLSVKLTRKQIEDCPPIEWHKPVSRQYEEEYHRHYGWPYYWEGDGLWGGMRGFPILETPPNFSPAGPPAAFGPKAERPDAHLHSAQAVTGYHLQATDGITGHVCDFLMDPKSWAITQLVIKIGHRFTGKEVQLPMGQVERISYKESTVFVKLTREAVEKSPAYDPVPVPVVPIAPPGQAPRNPTVTINQTP